MQTSQSLHHYIYIIYIDTVYIISLHQVFLVLLLSLFVSPNSQGPEDAGVSALRVFRSFCCVGLIHWCVPCRLVYHTVSICIRCIRYTLFIFVSSQGFGNSMAVVSLVHLASERHIRCWFSTFRTCFAPVKLARQFQEILRTSTIITAGCPSSAYRRRWRLWCLWQWGA